MEIVARTSSETQSWAGMAKARGSNQCRSSTSPAASSRIEVPGWIKMCLQAKRRNPGCKSFRQRSRLPHRNPIPMKNRHLVASSSNACTCRFAFVSPPDLPVFLGSDLTERNVWPCKTKTSFVAACLEPALHPEADPQPAFSLALWYPR